MISIYTPYRHRCGSRHPDPPLRKTKHTKSFLAMLDNLAMLVQCLSKSSPQVVSYDKKPLRRQIDGSRTKRSYVLPACPMTALNSTPCSTYEWGQL
jgi:hypothetical protein